MTDVTNIISDLILHQKLDVVRLDMYSNDLEHWRVKQGVSERSVVNLREHANSPKFCDANSPKQKSMPHFISYESSSTSLESFLTLIKTSEDLRFTILTDLFATDFLNRAKRFEVVYNLLSLKLNKRILVKVYINESDAVPSVSRIFSAACWYEREAYDMYGINFTGSHDTRRILTDYGFEGFPLRKDFPLYGYVQVKYDDITNKVVYEPVKLDQKYREFDFASPWNGPKYVLPGDEKAQK